MPYKYYAMIPVNYSSDGAQTDYQVRLTIYKSSGTNAAGLIYLNDHAENWPYDIEFRNASDTVLEYWRESYDTVSMVVWVKLDSIASSGTTNFYIHYGLLTATDASSGSDTFIFYEPWDNLDAWDTGGSPSVSGGELTINAAPEYVKSRTAYNIGTALRMRIKFVASINYFGFGYNNATGGDTTTCAENATYSTPAQKTITGAGTGPNTVNTYAADYTGDYHIWEIKRKQAANYDVKFDVDNSTKFNHTAYCPSSTLKLLIECHTTAGTLYCDWLFVRKYTVNEPSWAAPSGEYGLERIFIFPRVSRGSDDLSFYPASSG